jgi:hypothetical protein
MRRGRPPLGERSGIAERASMYMDASLAAQLRTYMSMYQVFNKAEALRQLVVFALERTLQTQDGSVVTPKQNSTTDIHDDGGISWWCDSCRWSGTFVHKADDTYELKVTHKKKTKVA